jgi:hypothetical protein
MMTNKHICTQDTKVGIYKWKRGVNNKLTLPERIPKLSKDIISMCLEIEPDKRPSCDKLFQHNWFEEQGSFERWIKLQNLLPESSDSKQDEAALTQEISKREMRKMTLCQRLCPNFMSEFRRVRSLMICGLIFLLIATFNVVLFTCFMSNENEPGRKKSSDRVRARRVLRTGLCEGCEWTRRARTRSELFFRPGSFSLDIKHVNKTTLKVAIRRKIKPQIIKLRTLRNSDMKLGHKRWQRVIFLISRFEISCVRAASSCLLSELSGNRF